MKYLIYLGCLMTSAVIAGQNNEPVISDPRPELSKYLDVIKKGDQKIALEYWFNDSPAAEINSQRDLVIAYVKEFVARSALSDLVKRKIPTVSAAINQFLKVPENEQVLEGTYLVYKNTAIVKWGNGPDDGLPMIYENNNGDKGRWKISTRQWFETNRSTLGNAMLMSGAGEKAVRLVAKDVESGKVRTKDELIESLIQYSTKD